MTDFADKGLHNWHEAIKQQGKGWRLPTIFELIDLGWWGCWSSTPDACNAYLAWSITNNGIDDENGKTYSFFHARLIRGKPSEQKPVTGAEVGCYKQTLHKCYAYRCQK